MNTHDQHHFNESKNVGLPKAEGLDTAALPAVVDRATWQAELDKLRVREKAHTREGDAIAAARRRLPMVEVDPTIQLVGPHGPVTLLEVFEGRRLLIAYFHMLHTGQPAGAQCEGCTFYNGQVRELSILHSRDVTYATFCQGPYEESVRYRDFMGWDVPWYSVQDAADALLAGRQVNRFYLVCYLRHEDRVFETYWTNGRGVEVMAPSYGLLDRTVYGRQETWEDSPAGWPQRWGETPANPTPTAPTDVPPPNGPGWRPDAPTTWAPGPPPPPHTAANTSRDLGKEQERRSFFCSTCYAKGGDEKGTLSGRCHAPREEDKHPCMVVWHMRTSALSMMERLAAALAKSNVLFALVSCVSMHVHGCRSERTREREQVDTVFEGRSGYPDLTTEGETMLNSSGIKDHPVVSHEV